MNNCILIGNLTKDPELRYTKENIPIASFSIAINRLKDGVDYIPIKVFNKQAENCKRYLTKGSKVAIEGSIRTGSYEKEDGTKIYTTEIMANKVHFLSSNINTQESQKQAQNEPQNRSSNELDDEVFAQFGDSISIDDDEIAF